MKTRQNKIKQNKTKRNRNRNKKYKGGYDPSCPSECPNCHLSEPIIKINDPEIGVFCICTKCKIRVD
jgi:hypothetical protein